MGVTRCPATLALALILFEEEGEGFSSLPERPSFALFFDLVSEVEVLTKVISGGIGPMRLALVLRFGAFCRRACCSTFVLFLASAVLLPSVECCNLRTFSLFFCFGSAICCVGALSDETRSAGSVFSQASVSF